MRVISGSLRGRDLGSVPDGVRPTSDRVRESLFGVLGSVQGLRVLDLFAGTGALGLEAVSRGANGVVFVERSRQVVRALRWRIQKLGLEEGDSLRVLAVEARRAITRLSQEDAAGFDLVFMDPPYAEVDRAGTLETLVSSAILADQSMVVVEAPRGHPVPPVAGLRVLEERRYGDTTLTWLAHAAQAER
jgi:16S rRNA (guanine(966)-N(2))-methyltransferase RsmD